MRREDLNLVALQAAAADARRALEEGRETVEVDPGVLLAVVGAWLSPDEEEW